MNVKLLPVLSMWLCLCLPAGWAAEPETGDTWNQWRGPTRDGAFHGKPWPDTIDETALQRQWRVELGPSYSGPIVSEKLVYTTSSEEGRWETVRAYDRRTGELAWETRWEGAMTVPFFAWANGSWIRATPAFDGESLYVAGMRDVLVCLDAASGEQRWRVDFVEQFGTPLPAFGFVCSPLADGDFLYVQAGAAFCKLDKRTGEVLWRTLKDTGGMYGSAFSSPVMAELAGRRQAVVQTRTLLAGVDPDSGEVLWSRAVPATRGMNILTPTVHGDTVFTSSHGGKTWVFDILRDEQGVFSTSERWEGKWQGYMSSPVVIDGHAYLHLRNQRLACVDLRDGAERWISRPYGKYWSMVFQENRILALDERGDLLLIEAVPEEFRVSETRRLSEQPSWAHLAVCNGQLFVRELNALTAYSWEAAESEQAAAAE